ncbi:MAG: hypothetical protein ACRDZZ_01165, partial [Ilumatobacteraceae bacterium]
MPDAPVHDDDQIDRLLREAGDRMRATNQVASPLSTRRSSAGGPRRRWIVPVAIVSAAAAAVVAALWLAGPATESVREVPADSSLGTIPDSVPQVTSGVTTPPATAPETSAPAHSVPPSEPSDDVALITVTDPDFDGAGGACLRFASAAGTADGCFTHRQLEDTESWTVAFATEAWAIT